MTYNDKIDKINKELDALIDLHAASILQGDDSTADKLNTLIKDKKLEKVIIEGQKYHFKGRYE